ncbi:DNA alkylation repair protein [Corynebacterium choanae]|uniref:DNA alkylation repair enzyme n=1 Tax=Corynebacterium choanae TaxID=1862358 RepID=A0A3G6J8G4_9CORY|nr:DNA alkylation repair protein [Corynebacterium choanae]AZA13188.1 DNA alkylation repair enzyme [Corynebacterium choanae]
MSSQTTSGSSHFPSVTAVYEAIAHAGSPSRAAFSAKLTPTLDPHWFTGTPMPVLRQLARNIGAQPDLREAYQATRNHPTVETRLVHMLLINQASSASEAIRELRAFLPQINCWQITDCYDPKPLLRKPDQRPELLAEAARLISEHAALTIRLGIICYLQDIATSDEFPAKTLHTILQLDAQDYYVAMAAGWYTATVFAKYPAATTTTLTSIIDRIVAGEHHYDAGSVQLGLRKICESRITTDDQRQWAKSQRERLKTAGVQRLPAKPQRQPS